MIQLNAIAAMCDYNNGIGKNNDLPWTLPKDFNYFLRFISTFNSKNKVNALIVGRKTWNSIPHNMNEFKMNLIVVVSSRYHQQKDNLDYKSYDVDKIIIAESFNAAINLINEKYSHLVDSIIAIGGTNIYSEAIKSNHFNRFYLTRIFKYFDCDTFIEPKDFLSQLSKLKDENLLQDSKWYDCQYNQKVNENGVDFIFEVYQKFNS